MATYFHLNSEIQVADGTMQTLYLMNPNYVPYSDTTYLPNNALLLSHAPPSNDHHHPLVGIPLPTPSTNIPQTSSEDINNRSSSLQPAVPGIHYDLWSSSIDQNSTQNNTQMTSLAAPAPGNSTQLGLPRSVASTSSRQGLSLSLSSQRPAHSRPINVEGDTQVRGQITVISTGDLMRVSESSPSSVSVVSNGISSIQSVIMGSKYLTAAQELLDEVIKVGDVINTDSTEEIKVKMKLNKESNMATTGEEAYSGGESSSNRGASELTTAQKQELQIKKAKLLNMLDEVERRYKQYHHQMQLVVSVFEQAAGFGSAKSYSSLALRTISKQFRSLKDAISAQIKATSKKLGEDYCVGAKVEGSRLRFVDHQLRQQRALQQLGMIQHHAWRPQRGLPERAVTILRAWLFEHFLHPYPKDSDKQMLAKQTGLTRSQVSNWFINARVRLWKPMVEDMYLEEMKDQERNGTENASKIESKESTKSEQVKTLQAKAEKPRNQISSPTELSNSTISTSPMGAHQLQTGFNLIGRSSDHVEGAFRRIRQKKPRNTEMQHSPSSMLSIDMDMKQGETSRDIGGKFFGREMMSKDGYSLITGISDHGGGFGAYSMGADIGRFNPDHLRLSGPRFHGNNNGVSLTLGLPRCQNLSISEAQQNLLSSHNIQLGRGLELGSGEADFCGIDTPQPSHSSTGGYDNIDIQNRKRFAAQLLPDFVT